MIDDKTYVIGIIVVLLTFALFSFKLGNKLPYDALSNGASGPNVSGLEPSLGTSDMLFKK